MDNLAPSEWRVEANIPAGPYDSTLAAKHALMVFAIKHGFSLVVKTSHPNSVIMQCSHGGTKRSYKPEGWAPTNGKWTLRTKKVGCGYEIKLRRLPGTESWSATVAVAVHSGHLQLSELTIGSLPSARKFLLESDQLKAKIEKTFTAVSSTSVIWNQLRSKHAWIMLKDIENVVHAMKLRQLGGLTEIEALHAKLKSDHVVSGSVLDSDNRIKHLWFSPQASQGLCQRYCDILLMDSTYKTNKHMMPLLHVVGVTGTHDTFTVACYFIAG